MLDFLVTMGVCTIQYAGSGNNDTISGVVDSGFSSGVVVVTILAIIGWGITVVIVVLILVKYCRNKKKGKYNL